MKKCFKVPVEWIVYDTVEVEAETFEDAVQYVLDNKDEIPLGTEPDYVDGSYVVRGEDEAKTDQELIELLKSIGFGKPIIFKY